MGNDGCGCKGSQGQTNTQNTQPKGEKGRTPSSTIIRDSDEGDSK
jgi:hypothetical protein